MKLKSYEDCLAWITAVEAYRKAAPEGVYMAHADAVITLRNVEPAAITRLSQEKQVARLISPFTGEIQVQLDGSEEGAYYSVTILGKPSHAKFSRNAFRFFYLNRSKQ